MSGAPHPLLITLVHGTWGRGFFPRRQRQNRRPLWFEEGSPFLARLSTELGDMPHKITPLLWSGANSIFVRDKTAHALAEHLAAEHAEHPQANQLVVAHSHGGNIALRALRYLGQRSFSQPDEANGANPLVVTLATPFIEVHSADMGKLPDTVRCARIMAIAFPVFFLMSPLIFLSSYSLAIIYGITFGGAALIALLSLWSQSQRPTTARQNRVNALNDATQLDGSGSAQRLLVIRAVDDEASLILALGAIVNYLTARFIRAALVIFTLSASISIAWNSVYTSLHPMYPPPVTDFSTTTTTAEALKNVSQWLDQWQEHNFILLYMWYVVQGWTVLTILLFSILMISRSIHGRELAVSPMECQINTQSAPDAGGLSKIVTLVRRAYAKSLRHGIYDHEDCAKTISDWVRLQLSPVGEARS